MRIERTLGTGAMTPPTFPPASWGALASLDGGEGASRKRIVGSEIRHQTRRKNLEGINV
jgi:hypothetical protein